jgi:hypothetical protein
MVSGTSWTKVGDVIVFLSRDGLYRVGANGAGLEDISGDSLPWELSDIDPLNYTVRMGYRHSESGVYIFVEGDAHHWFYDLKLKGFWPFVLPAGYEPSSVFHQDGEMVVWGGSSSYWSFEGSDDLGTAIQSHVLLGPFQMGSPGEFGMLAALHGIIETADVSETVTWRIVTGKTAEDAVSNAKLAVDWYLDGDTETAESYVSASGTLKSGRSRMQHPRVRAMWNVIWLQSNYPWAFEGLVVESSTFGNWR